MSNLKVTKEALFGKCKAKETTYGRCIEVIIGLNVPEHHYIREASILETSSMDEDKEYLPAVKIIFTRI